jgi:arylsulfatase A-like enzyme
VQITDWMPTFCALTGYQPDRDLNWDGKDITSLLTEHQPLADRPIYTVGPQSRASSLRYGDWKLIVQGTGESKKQELYNIKDDPEESKNLAAADPDRLKDMLTKLAVAAERDRDSVAR